MSRTLVFARTKHGADKVVRALAAAGIVASAIHGNKSQSQRVATMNAFRAGRTRVLVATDIAARGIDVDGLLGAPGGVDHHPTDRLRADALVVILDAEKVCALSRALRALDRPREVLRLAVDQGQVAVGLHHTQPVAQALHELRMQRPRVVVVHQFQ